MKLSHNEKFSPCTIEIIIIIILSYYFSQHLLPSVSLPLRLSWQRICLQCKRTGFDPWVGKIPWRKERLPTSVFWPGEFHGLYHPWGCKESDMTERILFSLSLTTSSQMLLFFFLFVIVFLFPLKCVLHKCGEIVFSVESPLLRKFLAHSRYTIKIS